MLVLTFIENICFHTLSVLCYYTEVTTYYAATNYVVEPLMCDSNFRWLTLELPTIQESEFRISHQINY